MESESLKEFKNNFAKIYREKVAPQLKFIDNERLVVKKKALTYASIVIAIGAVLLLIYFFNYNDYFLIIGGLIIITGFSIYSAMSKGFEFKLKKQIMPLLMQAFGNFNWTNSAKIDTQEIKNSKIFLRFTKRSTDDNFYGTYRDMPIEISETKLSYRTTSVNGKKHNVTEFRGVLISIGMGKNFTGHTIVRTKDSMSNKSNFVNPLTSYNNEAYEDKQLHFVDQISEFVTRKTIYEEVKLEDPEFEKIYFVDSNDQIEARFLLTPAFMERFKNISTAFGTDETQCSFKEGKILIALSTPVDLFKLGDLNTPVTDTAPYMEFLKEIISIFKMIDHLKVTEKTGL